MTEALDAAAQAEKQAAYEKMRAKIRAETEARDARRFADEEKRQAEAAAHARMTEAMQGVMAPLPDETPDLATIGCTTPEQCMASGCGRTCPEPDGRISFSAEELADLASGGGPKTLDDILAERVAEENAAADRRAARLEELHKWLAEGPRPDPIVAAVAKRLQDRSAVGMVKYDVGLDRQDLGLLDWLQHLQDELLDAANYIERLKVMLLGVKS